MTPPTAFKYSKKQWQKLSDLLTQPHGKKPIQLSDENLAVFRSVLEDQTQYSREVLADLKAGKLETRSHIKILRKLQNSNYLLLRHWRLHRPFLEELVEEDLQNEDLATPPSSFSETFHFLTKLESQFRRLSELVSRTTEEHRDAPEGYFRSSYWRKSAIDSLLNLARRIWIEARRENPSPQKLAGEPYGPFSVFCFEIASNINHGLSWSGLKARIEALRKSNHQDKHPIL